MRLHTHQVSDDLSFTAKHASSFCGSKIQFSYDTFGGRRVTFGDRREDVLEGSPGYLLLDWILGQIYRPTTTQVVLIRNSSNFD